MSERLDLNLPVLQSLQRFGDTLYEAISGIESEEGNFQADRDSSDCIGRHWYGMRCHLHCKKTGNYFYLHIGLIYHEDTRAGLMVELDEKQNPVFYSIVREKIKPGPGFEISLEEKEYLKLFLPEEDFQDMQGKSRGTQREILKKFVKSAGEAVIMTARETGFSFSLKDLAGVRRLGEAFRETLMRNEEALYRVEINEKDKDNFGQYASGYRYHLKDKKEQVDFYAYFGVIYSYKKGPRGIFAEIDRFSNPETFDKVSPFLPESERYQLSRREPGFLKLFLPAELEGKFQKAEETEQKKILDEFLTACNEAILKAYEKGAAI